VLVGMDEPEHKRHRALVSAAFRHKSLVRWETEVVDPIMHDLIDGFADRDAVAQAATNALAGETQPPPTATVAATPAVTPPVAPATTGAP